VGIHHRDKSWPKAELSNPRLLAAMQRDIDERTPEAEALVFKELMRGRFLVPLADEENGQAESETHADTSETNGTGLPIITFVDDGEHPIVIAFTDSDACRNWSTEDLRYAILDSGAVFNLARGHGAAGLVLNPSGPMRTELTADEIEALAEGKQPHV
jgi:hypothetical protein